MLHQSQLLSHLTQRLTEPLPGIDAQLKLAPSFRPNEPPPQGAKSSAVLALISYESNWKITFIVRASGNTNDRHAGQISFPGGKHDPNTDANLLETALRETLEEVGIPSHHINILGALTQLYIPVSNFNVQPFVGYLPASLANFVPESNEVADIITASLADLRQQPIKNKMIDVFFGGKLINREIPYLDLQGHTLWGATAMIISELLEVLPSDFDTF